MLVGGRQRVQQAGRHLVLAGRGVAAGRRGAGVAGVGGRGVSVAGGGVRVAQELLHGLGGRGERRGRRVGVEAGPRGCGQGRRVREAEVGRGEEGLLAAGGGAGRVVVVVVVGRQETLLRGGHHRLHLQTNPERDSAQVRLHRPGAPRSPREAQNNTQTYTDLHCCCTKYNNNTSFRSVQCLLYCLHISHVTTCPAQRYREGLLSRGSSLVHRGSRLG